MTTTALVASLAADLGVFLAAAALVALVVGGGRVLDAPAWSRSVHAAGGVLLCVASAVHGSGGVTDLSAPMLVTMRAAALVLIAAGSLGIADRRPRLVLMGALVLFATSEIALAFDSLTTANVVRAIAAGAVGLAISLAANRTVATRIGAAAGVLLVAVVLVLSSTLSVVLTRSVSREALRRAGERARTEAGIIEAQADAAFRQTTFLQRLLQAGTVLRGGSQDTVTRVLQTLQSDYTTLDVVAFLDTRGGVVGSSKLSPAETVALAGSQPAHDAIAGTPANGIEPLGDDALVALAAQPVQIVDARGVPVPGGAVIAGFRLDDRFLTQRRRSEAGVNLSLVTSRRVLASTLSDPPRESAAVLDKAAGKPLIEAAIANGTIARHRGQYHGREVYVAAYPIRDASRTPVGAIVVTTRGTLAASTRDALARTLFLVALGAALVALALAVLAGDRIGRPLRRLTAAAEQIRAGDLAVRGGIHREDEIGALGASFDEMAASIERMAGDLREAAAQRQAILTGMSDGLVATDANGRVLLVNPAAEQMLDVRENRVLGVRVGKLIRGRDRAGNEFDSRFGSSTTEAWSASGFLDHDTWPVAIAAAPIRDDAARLVGAVYALRDMRREHEVERMKTEFLSNISHELRTPLTPIKGYAEMLRLRRVPPGRARAFLDGILDASERLERIIDILVNFAALEAGRLVLRTEDVDVASVVHGLSERWQSRTPHHQVEEKVSSRMPRVVADRRLLERSIDELIDNAVKYSPEGGRIVVGVKVSANGSGRALTITVTDQGLGIEPDDVPKIFADFQQLDGSATRRFGGLGLGLPFVQRVVEAHRGHITVDSEPGTGSVFMITLPIEGPATRARSNA